jgi:hypothetical protein
MMRALREARVKQRSRTNPGKLERINTTREEQEGVLAYMDLG